MILHPAVIALLASSLFISLMVLYASFFGLQVLLKWDLRSGSETQLRLERKTYLISTVLAYAFGFELISLFLFVFTADNLHTLFVGAMCAAGTLYVNPLGYPALIAKAAVFMLAGLWLIMNHADNRAPNYPLIKKKYALLLVMAPLFLTEAALQGGYLLLLRADVITSCCGTLFSSAERAGPWALSMVGFPVRTVFFPSVALTVLSGAYFSMKGRGGYVFSAAALAALPVSILALIYYVSPYIYELPSHACPFCILKGEYGHVGYPLYLSLLGGALFGAGTGVVHAFRNVESLREVVQVLSRRLALASLVLYLVFLSLVLYSLSASGLVID